MSWCRRWRTSTKESLVLWAQECQSLMLRCSATLTMFRVTLVWIVLPSRPLLSCISETYMYAWLPGLLPPESYRTCYYINYVPKSLMYLDGILVFYCWIGSLEFRRCAVLVLMPGLFSKSLWYCSPPWKRVQMQSNIQMFQCVKIGSTSWPETQWTASIFISY